MGRRYLIRYLAVTVAIFAVFGYYIAPLSLSVKQGLDLQGGTHIVLQAVDTPEAKVDDDAVNRVMQIIERRINELGLTEPLVQRQGERRIIVELPGINEPEKAIELIGKTALLEFKDESGQTVLTGKDLKDAKAQIDQNRHLVAIEFSEEGGRKFADLTAKNVGKTISILLDQQVLTSPVVQEVITGGKAVITGNRSMDEAQRLAILLRSGSLPVKVDVMETRSVGPTLGQDAKDKSVVAFSIGIGAVIIFMLLFYRLSGFIANTALLIYVLLLMLSMKLLNATLTLPGIAGVILSIGMAVDANVLIFERFKEEYRNGKTLRAAMDAGFDRAFATVLDSNLTTLIAAIVLFFLGTSTVKGFAITLALGNIISMFTAVTVNKFLLKMIMRAGVFKDGKIFGA